MRIGFVGLGRMGTHMVRNLARAGIEVVLWNRTRQKAEDLASSLGAAVADTPASLAAECDVVITMLADDASSELVHFGKDGLFSLRNRDGDCARYFIEMGTMSPKHIDALVEAAPPGAFVIDAPVSGATQAAEAAQLTIMAGCDEAVAGPLTPIFSAVGNRTICLGRAGAGAAMKLAVNSLIHGLNQTLAEALTLAEAAGIRTDTAFDVIEASAACAPMLKYRRALYLNESAHEVTFTVALARKDMAVAAELAQSLGIAMPQGTITLSKLMEAEAAGYAARDMASIVNFMRENNR